MDIIRTQEEARWLTDVRRRAWMVFQDTPLPAVQSEEWKYTDLSRLSLDDFLAPSLTARPLDVRRSGQNGWARQGVIFTDLLPATREYPARVGELLHTLVPASQWKLSALHAALLNGGTFLYVPPGVEVEIPLRSQYVASSSSSFPHTLIVLGEGSTAAYIDEYVGDGRETGLSVAHVEIILEDNAELMYFNIQHYSSQVTHFVTQAARLGRGAKLTSVSVALGGRLVRGDLRVLLAGQGSRSDILGVILGDGAQRFDTQTLQEHTAPDTLSDLLFKAALKDVARSAYTGLIHIGKTAQKSNAYQANRNLLMNRGARSFSTPKLEIEADDVRCTHGATMGTFDEEQLFYLMSRGIEAADARRLMIEGFFDPVIGKVPDMGLRTRLWSVLGTKLASMTSAGGTT